MLKRVVCLAVLGLVALFAASIWLRGKAVPQASDYVQGIDISHYQGVINWRDLDRTDIQFVFMKATEGATFVDSRFAHNWRQARDTDMLRGAYHFFTQCRAVEAQAANFINTVGDLTGSLPPVLDLEHMGPCRQGPTMSRPDLEVAKFMDILEAEYGVRPILYTTREFHDAYLVDLSKNEKFWVRSIFQAPKFRQKDWLFWQHHHRGRVKGIKGPVDLNAYRGTAEDLEKMRLVQP